MQPIREIIDDTSTASFNTMRVSLADKRPWWHYHPEIELTNFGAYLAEHPPGDFTVVTLGPRELEVPVGVS